MGGEELQVDKWQIDIALGGSQKVISAPPGLTIASNFNRSLSSDDREKKPHRKFLL